MPFETPKTQQPSEVVELTLPNGKTLPSIDGRFFCSRRDPEREALSWLKANEGLFSLSSNVVILGLGAGFHVQNFPGVKQLTVVELRSQLVDRWKWQVSRSDIQVVSALESSDEAVVLEFRPAWSGLEAEYVNLSRRLRGADLAALKTQAEKKDLWILAEALEQIQAPDGLELSIKDIVHAIAIENQSEEARMWRALRELVL